MLVSGVVSRNRDAPPVQLLSAILRGEVAVLLSTALISEYREVLVRPRIARLHGLSRSEVDSLVDRIVANAIVVAPPNTPAEGPDPNDVHLWRLLRAHPNAVLITGDLALIDHAPQGCNAITPRQWLDGTR